MNIYESQVGKFYKEVWEQHDKAVIPTLLAENIVFRGSLGQEKYGHEGFIEYLDYVRAGLSKYQCDIQELVSQNNKVFAKMLFSGLHSGEFLGYESTQRKISWAGAALFTFSGDKIVNLWVLGDTKSVEQQLLGDLSI